jgi:hypothetical protein
MVVDRPHMLRTPSNQDLKVRFTASIAWRAGRVTFDQPVLGARGAGTESPRAAISAARGGRGLLSRTVGPTDGLPSQI